MNSLAAIQISLFEHKGKTCYGLKFPFNNQLKDRLRTIDAVRWSATQTVFYVYEERLSLKALCEALQTLGLTFDHSTIPLEELIAPTEYGFGKRKLSEENTILLGQFTNYMKGLRLSESTMTTYYSFVLNFLIFIGDKKVEKLMAIDVRLFIEQQVIVKDYAVSTHRQMISGIKHFGFFMSLEALTDLDRFRPRKSSYLPTILSKEEAITLLRVTKNLKHRTILALLYSSGLRIGELISLELKCLDIDRRQIFVRSGKGRKDRVVIMAESFVPLFKNYFFSYRPKVYFIENPKGGMYTAGSVRSFLRKSCKEAGILKKVTPHTLRHSYATHLIEMGVGLRYVQDLLGHSKPETTMIYTHVARKDLLAIQSPLDHALTTIEVTDKNQLKSRFEGDISG